MTHQDAGSALAQDIAALLAEPGLAAAHIGGAPILIAAGSPPKVVYVSGAAASLFAANDHQVLTARLLEPGTLSANRLAVLAQRTPGAMPSLQRLRLPIGNAFDLITLQCRTLQSVSGTPMFVAVGMGVRPSLLRRSVPAAAAVPVSDTSGITAADDTVIEALVAVSAVPPAVEMVPDLAQAAPEPANSNAVASSAETIATPQAATVVAPTSNVSRQLPALPAASSLTPRDSLAARRASLGGRMLATSSRTCLIY